MISTQAAEPFRGPISPTPLARFVFLLAKAPCFFLSLPLHLPIVLCSCSGACAMRGSTADTMSWQPKLRPKGYPHTIDDFAVASLSGLEHRSRTGEDKRDQRVFRVKRKHVLKACDRCRVKKTKVCFTLYPLSRRVTDHRSVMGNSPAIAAQYTTTHAFSARGKLRRPRFTLEGELSYSSG